MFILHAQYWFIGTENKLLCVVMAASLWDTQVHYMSVCSYVLFIIDAPVQFIGSLL